MANETLFTDILKKRGRVKKLFPDKKLDFKKYPTYGMSKKDSDYDKARYDPEARKKRTARDRKNPEFLKKRRARAKDYYTREKENILKRAFDKYRSDTPVGKTGKTLKQLTKEKNIRGIDKLLKTKGSFFISSF